MGVLFNWAEISFDTDTACIIQASSVFRVDIVAAVLLPILVLPLALVLLPSQTSSLVQAFPLHFAGVVSYAP